jgi:hypothetical protein
LSFLLFCAAFAAGMEIAMARKVEMTKDFRVVAAIFCVLVGLLLAAYFLLPDPTLAP